MLSQVFSFNLTFAESFGNATPWIAAIVAGLIGVLYSLLHAVATINFRADHVVSGTVLTLSHHLWQYS